MSVPSLKILAIISANVFSASTIVLVNKKIFEHGFPYGEDFNLFLFSGHAFLPIAINFASSQENVAATALTAIHMVFQSLMLWAFSLLQGGSKEKKNLKLKFWDLLPCALSYALCMPLQNLSLQFNSVGANQVAKLLAIPVGLVTQWLWLNKGVTNSVFVSLAVTVFGTYVFMSSDLHGSFSGVTISIAMVCANCFNQITIEQNIVQHKIDSSTLLGQCIPYAVVTMIFFSLFFERSPDGLSPMQASVSLECLIWILLSTFLGLVVNLSTFAIVGKLSALTYKVLAHIKSCIIFAGSIVFLGSEYNLMQQFGFFITLTGVMLYMFLQHFSPSSSSPSSKMQHGSKTPSKKR